MDAKVWVSGSEQPAQAQTGDTVVAPAGDVVKVGEVLDGGDIAWRAEVAADLLPGLDQAAADAPLEDEELLRAVRGVLTAENNRGG